ncbi:nitrate- and nitrite sensing domain-containing protein [Nocardia asteroides]|uniref:sensor histidine kinase n=1 Tax=Nocardia asteroides TaxID=1824 RepID=UPI001E5616C4|nr:nitrate- and nitrite sensing domain-containing protein [Nocardia asteroides]UGT61848.1 nitrate- and nitrite sensing domain-containing protein [Nocardia asteroides]
MISLRTPVRFGFGSVRSRILTIALIPSLVLVIAVAGVMSHLVREADRDRKWADTILQSAPHAIAFNDAIVRERRLTLLRIAQRPHDQAALLDERRRVDAAVRGLGTVPTALSAIIPGTFDEFGASVDEAVRKLLELRVRVDAELSNVAEAYETFGRLTAVQARSVDIMAQQAPDAGSAVALANAARLFRAADAMSAAHGLAAAVATEDGLGDLFLQQFVGRVGAYHAEVGVLAASADEQLRARVAQLTGSPAWQSSAAFEAALIERGSSSRRQATATPEAASVEENAETSVEELHALWRTYYQQVQERVAGTAEETTRTAFTLGGVALGVTAIAFLATLWLANRMTRRLMRLRQETLGLADDRLPAIIARIHAGDDVDIGSALPGLDFGDDEIGQVARAFEAAQRTAVAAAVTEAKTRDAVNAVFLNLVHRSQLMAHRQLEVLDAAESREENPALLSLLFKLDHLATRERRNAENLIILGGERPGRQWRNPVSLRDIVRSAIAETEDYARVRAARLPDVRIESVVVADIIHLLAELIDNSLSYSPPASRVEVSGNPVGKGAVVEIIDQGLGMRPDELARVNALLADSPDFGVLQLSSDSRLGLIVVSVLAARNDIKVRLTESDYGGIKALVVIPAALLADEAAPNPYSTPPAFADDPAQGPLPITTSGPSHPAPADFGADPETASGARPSLPRRHRQASLAPQLSDRPVERTARPVATPRSAEQARDLIAKIAHGTEQGRRVPTRTPRDDEERRP